MVKTSKHDEAVAAYRLGAARHQAGALTQAEAAYRRALSVWPDFPECLAMTGLLLRQTGRDQEAVGPLRRATILKPAEPLFHEYLGDALRQVGRPEEAVAAYGKALHVNGGRPETFRGLGRALSDLNRWEPAVNAFGAALELNPLYAEAASDLGDILAHLSRLEEAVKLYEQAIALKPSDHNVHNRLGLAFQALGRDEAAIACFREALRVRPDSADALFNLGNLFQEKECWADALECLERGVTMEPQSTRGYPALSTALIRQRRFDDAGAVIERGLRIAPDSPDLRLNLGCVALMRGDYALGWATMHARRRLVQEPPTAWPRSKARTWDGIKDLSGKTVLLWAEQGFGDTIQFVRFVPLLTARGARVLLHVQPQLVSLLAGVEGVASCLGFGDKLPWHDLQYPLMGLPHALGIGLDQVVTRSPYLVAPSQAAADWRNRLSALPGRKVGLVWSSETRADQHDFFRLYRRRNSMRLAQLAPLAGVRDASFVSLQKGTPASQVSMDAPGFELHDWTEELNSFADTAGLIEGLDLVISVDTAVAHLAGALGRPVWLLVRFDSCWRWLQEREDSPWYPTLRLFRQRRPGDWDELLSRVRAELECL